jgi:hypothetical protein
MRFLPLYGCKAIFDWPINLLVSFRVLVWNITFWPRQMLHKDHPHQRLRWVVEKNKEPRPCFHKARWKTLGLWKCKCRPRVWPIPSIECRDKWLYHGNSLVYKTVPSLLLCIVTHLKASLVSHNVTWHFEHGAGNENLEKAGLPHLQASIPAYRNGVHPRPRLDLKKFCNHFLTQRVHALMHWEHHHDHEQRNTSIQFRDLLHDSLTTRFIIRT